MPKIKLKKVCNFRAIFCLFLVVIISIFGAVKCYSNKLYLLLLIFPVAYFVYLAIRHRFVLLGVSFFVLLGVTIFSYTNIHNFSTCVIPSGQVAVVATVEKITDKGSYYILNLKDLSYKEEEGEITQSLVGNATVFVNSTNFDINIKRYSTIAIMAIFEKNSVEDSYGYYYLYNNTRYKLNIVYGTRPVPIGREMNMLENFREYNLKLLVDGLGEENGNLCYSILYGDKSYLSTEDLNDYRNTGVVHLFAVSGLHVGLLVAVLVWLLSKCSVKGRAQFVTITVFLFVYCLLCSFTPSVVRASIMAICLLLSKLFSRKYDPLNALSLAGIILLALSPMSLFSTGFQLSFCATFGIIFLSRLFNLVHFKNSFAQELWNAIRITISAQMGVAPLMFYYFGWISAWSILANLLLVPLFTLFYTVLFAVNFFVVVCPQLQVIAKVPEAIFEVFRYFNNIIMGLPNGTIFFNKINLPSIVLYFVLLWTSSKYLVVSTKTRGIVAIILVLTITFFVITSDYYPAGNSVAVLDFFRNNSKLFLAPN